MQVLPFGSAYPRFAQQPVRRSSEPSRFVSPPSATQPQFGSGAPTVPLCIGLLFTSAMFLVTAVFAESEQQQPLIEKDTPSCAAGTDCDRLPRPKQDDPDTVNIGGLPVNVHDDECLHLGNGTSVCP